MEPPSIASISARIEPPAYTKRPTSVARDPARILAFEGSRVTLDITPESSRSARSRSGGRRRRAIDGPPPRWPTADRRGLSAIATESGPYNFP